MVEIPEVQALEAFARAAEDLALELDPEQPWGIFATEVARDAWISVRENSPGPRLQLVGAAK